MNKSLEIPQKFTFQSLAIPDKAHFITTLWLALLSTHQFNNVKYAMSDDGLETPPFVFGIDQINYLSATGECALGNEISEYTYRDSGTLDASICHRTPANMGKQTPEISK